MPHYSLLTLHLMVEFVVVALIIAMIAKWRIRAINVKLDTLQLLRIVKENIIFD